VKRTQLALTLIFVFSILVMAAATTGAKAPKRIYVYDGTSLQIYDPQTDSWTLGANPPINRQYLGIAVFNDLLYFIGGFTYTFPGFYNDYSTNEQYTPPGYGTLQERENMPSTLFPTNTIIATSGVTIAAVIVGLLVYFKKRKRKAEV
jgi:hypothetical protein